MKVRLFNFDIESSKKINENWHSGAFGCRNEYLRELSEADHEITIGEFVEYGIHLFPNFELLLLLLGHIAE